MYETHVHYAVIDVVSRYIIRITRCEWCRKWQYFSMTGNACTNVQIDNNENASQLFPIQKYRNNKQEPLQF